MKIKGYQSIGLLRTVQAFAWMSFPFVLIFPSTFNIWYFIVGVILLTSIGSSAGLHRYFGHKSFKTGKIRHWLLALLATLTTQGSVALWIVYHRSHHVYADTKDDLISPTFIGFWKSLFAIQDFHSYKGVRPRDVARELQDAGVKFFHDWYWVTIFVYIATLSLIDPILVLNMYLLPVFMVRFIFGLQNTFGHGVPSFCGYRNHETVDRSLNSPIVNILTFCLGETLHNNHHANPGKYDYREKWFELDLTGFIIKRLLLK